MGATAPVAADVSDREANERAAQAAMNLNEGQPITNIQVGQGSLTYRWVKGHLRSGGSRVTNIQVGQG